MGVSASSALRTPTVLESIERMFMCHTNFTTRVPFLMTKTLLTQLTGWNGTNTSRRSLRAPTSSQSTPRAVTMNVRVMNTSLLLPSGSRPSSILACPATRDSTSNTDVLPVNADSGAYARDIRRKTWSSSRTRPQSGAMALEKFMMNGQEIEKRLKMNILNRSWKMAAPSPGFLTSDYTNSMQKVNHL